MKAKFIAIAVALIATATGVSAPNGYSHNRASINSSITLRVNSRNVNGTLHFNNHRNDWSGCYTPERHHPRYVTVATQVVVYDRYGYAHIRTVYRQVLVR